MSDLDYAHETTSSGASSIKFKETEAEDFYTSTDKPKQTEWLMSSDLRRLEALEAHNDHQPRRLGISWSNLTLKGANSGIALNENVLSSLNPVKRSPPAGEAKIIIDSSHGCVKPGEMLLVLGSK